MGKFDKALPTGSATLTSPVQTSGRTTTHEGGEAYSRTAKSDLFMLAVVNMVGEDTFYESASERDTRFNQLVRQVTLEDPVWVSKFIPWLRDGANMRSASIVAACQFVKARLEAGVTSGPSNRRVIDLACQRLDEPAEVLAYWSTTFGVPPRSVPKPVKRGVADAVARLTNEYAALKYDGQSRNIRLGDVLDITHPKPTAPWQGELFTYLLDRRHNRDNVRVGENLAMIRARQELAELSQAEQRARLLGDPELMKRAGYTWEQLSSLGAMDAPAWEAVIPNMGYMALLRNLRNFDEAGVSDTVAATVAARLSDPAQVAKSRQFPYRFLAAYENAPSLRWSHPLEQALGYATSNIPELEGETIVLVDTSASMHSTGYSRNSTMTPAKSAAVFGTAIAKRTGNVRLYGFADGVFEHKLPKGFSMLKEIDRFLGRIGEVGHGTQIASAVRATVQPTTKRIVIVSDMQTFRDPWGAGRGTVSNDAPATVKMYGFNLGGYSSTVIDAGKDNRHEFGGMNDATFRMLALLESARSSKWPWEIDS